MGKVIFFVLSPILSHLVLMAALSGGTVVIVPLPRQERRLPEVRGCAHRHTASKGPG